MICVFCVLFLKIESLKKYGLKEYAGQNRANTDHGHYTRLSRFAGDLRNCSDLIRQTSDLLRAENLSYSCSALEETDCELTYQRIYSRSSPESVLSRSRRCDLNWPEFGDISSEERDFPLAYFLTVYTDARILELTLATIFRPHNSYCIHIDKKAEEMFKRTVLQLINCYQAKVNIASQLYKGRLAQHFSRRVNLVTF